MKLKPKARKALWESIQHWLENWEDPRNAVTKSIGCPLCAAFLDATPHLGCDGCPVKEASGFNYCDRTPWGAVSKAKIRATGISWTLSSEEIGRRHADYILAIATEYQFLVDIALNDDEFGFAPEE